MYCQRGISAMVKNEGMNWLSEKQADLRTLNKLSSKTQRDSCTNMPLYQERHTDTSEETQQSHDPADTSFSVSPTPHCCVRSLELQRLGSAVAFFTFDWNYLGSLRRVQEDVDERSLIGR